MKHAISREPGPNEHRHLRRAARAMGRHGLAHAYGHCSLRLDEQRFLVSAPLPLGLIPPDAAGTVVSVDGDLPTDVLGEVRLHQRIYRQRQDVQGICRTMPPNLMSLSAIGKVPRPRHGMGTYFWPEPPLWRDVQLIRDDASADAAIARMGNSSALVMMGNGVIVCADSLVRACVLTWFLEDAARIELDVLRCGLEDSMRPISEEAARRRAVWSGGIDDRMWRYLTDGDVESE